MIDITKATKKEIENFEDKEWHGLDIEHYGKKIDWNEKDFIFKATENEEIVGTVTGKHGAGVIFIDTLMVKEGERGKGIGQLLLAAVEEFGKSMKAHKLWLYTGQGWKAKDFYEKVGFKELTILPDHHFHQDFIIYEKSLE